MKDILLKRNELRTKSINLRTLKFDPSIKDKLTTDISNEQDKIYKKYKFYDSFIKAREGAKNEHGDMDTNKQL